MGHGRLWSTLLVFLNFGCCVEWPNLSRTLWNTQSAFFRGNARPYSSPGPLRDIGSIVVTWVEDAMFVLIIITGVDSGWMLHWHMQVLPFL